MRAQTFYVFGGPRPVSVVTHLPMEEGNACNTCICNSFQVLRHPLFTDISVDEMKPGLGVKRAWRMHEKGKVVFTPFLVQLCGVRNGPYYYLGRIVGCCIVECGLRQHGC